MTTKNIWSAIDFTDNPGQSAYDLLLPQKDKLRASTGGELVMEVEAIDAYSNTEPPRPAALYVVFVVAPKLNNFRRKILTVLEHRMEGYFPVTVFNHVESIKDQEVSETDFLDVISKVLSRPKVQSVVQGLYRHSKSIG